MLVGYARQPAPSTRRPASPRSAANSRPPAARGSSSEQVSSVAARRRAPSTRPSTSPARRRHPGRHPPRPAGPLDPPTWSRSPTASSATRCAAGPDAGPGHRGPTGQLMVNMLGSIAQFERCLMLERQREGIAEAKRRASTRQAGHGAGQGRRGGEAARAGPRRGADRRALHIVARGIGPGSSPKPRRGAAGGLRNAPRSQQIILPRAALDAVAGPERLQIGQPVEHELAAAENTAGRCRGRPSATASAGRTPRNAAAAGRFNVWSGNTSTSIWRNPRLPASAAQRPRQRGIERRVSQGPAWANSRQRTKILDPYYTAFRVVQVLRTGYSARNLPIVLPGLCADPPCHGCHTFFPKPLYTLSFLLLFTRREGKKP